MIPGGPDGLFATLPLRDIRDALTRGGIPAALSLSAGTYVCNNVMYHLLYRLRERGGTVPGGFVHVPFLPEQAAAHPGAPSMDARLITRALGIILETAALSVAK